MVFCFLQPEKRSRKLSRPRSLTNIVWEIREHPNISIVEKATAKKIVEPDAIVYKKPNKYPIAGGGQAQRRETLYL